MAPRALIKFVAEITLGDPQRMWAAERHAAT